MFRGYSSSCNMFQQYVLLGASLSHSSFEVCSWTAETQSTWLSEVLIKIVRKCFHELNKKTLNIFLQRHQFLKKELIVSLIVNGNLEQAYPKTVLFFKIILNQKNIEILSKLAQWCLNLIRIGPLFCNSKYIEYCQTVDYRNSIINNLMTYKNPLSYRESLYFLDKT